MLSSFSNSQKDQNITVAITIGASRPVTFTNLFTGEAETFPIDSGDVYLFSGGVNLGFTHQVDNAPEDNNNNEEDLRYSIVFWGKCMRIPDSTPVFIDTLFAKARFLARQHFWHA